jgi:hypothetical protein
MNEKTNKLGDYSVFWVTCIVYALAFMFVFSARMGTNVLGIKYAKAGYLHHLYPAKWNFYTRRTSLDKIYRLYKVNNNKLIYQDNRPFTSQFLYGLQRDCKVIFCETETIAKDTLLATQGIKYTVTVPETGDINKFIRPDTIRYNNMRPANVYYLKGKYLVTVEEQLTWQQIRKAPHQPKTITVIPINIAAK